TPRAHALSLHDALPISVVLVHGHVDRGGACFLVVEAVSQVLGQGPYAAVAGGHDRLSGELRALFRWYVFVDGLLRRFLSGPTQRSEEHTSELQSRFDLV